MNVHVCIADPGTGFAVSKLLAANPNMRVTRWRPEHFARSPLTRDTGSELRDRESPVDIDVLLFGPEDLRRCEEDQPGRVDELQRRAKVLLLLERNEVPEALELLRRCDGMIVKDVNLGHVADIIEFALHGYFVIPRNLVADFMLVGAPTRAAIVEKIGLGVNGESAARLEYSSREASSREYCATRTTMRNAIRNVLKSGGNGARAQLNAAAIGGAAEDEKAALAKESTVRLAKWRGALRDNDGRVAKGEYVLLLAAVALWGAIILDTGGSKKLASAFGSCAAIATSVQCGVLANAPTNRSAANLAGAAKSPFALGDALKTTVKGAKDLEYEHE